MEQIFVVCKAWIDQVTNIEAPSRPPFFFFILPVYTITNKQEVVCSKNFQSHIYD